jgi:hypothetical protein
MSMNPSRRVVESLRLSDLAVDNRIITVRCILCRAADHYLAKDLQAVRGDVLYSTVGGACRRCGKREWIPGIAPVANERGCRAPSHQASRRGANDPVVAGRLVWVIARGQGRCRCSKLARAAFVCMMGK